MDRNAKLAAARKKLKQFKRKKAQRAANSPGNPEANPEPADPVKNPESHEKDILEIKKSEEFIDEKFELLNCTEDENLSESTAATTESILQVSAKLNGIAAEADMFVDDASIQSSEEKFQMIEHPKAQDRETQNDLINTLEVRNQELAAKLSLLSQEKEELNGRCQHLSDELRMMQKQFEEKEKWRSVKTGEENALHEQLQIQMQTIGVLVSEKQDLQQELLAVRSELHTSNLQQKKWREDLQLMKEKVVLHERDLQAKNDTMTSLEYGNAQLQSEFTSCKNELDHTKKVLEKEQMQTSELGVKLQAREMEYRELYTSHADAREKLEMADILLQQMSTNNNSDTASQFTQLQQENQSLISRLNEYQQAFEHLSAEREHLSRQYSDAQSKWEDHLQSLQLKVQSLEMEKHNLSHRCDQLQTSLETKITEVVEKEGDASPSDITSQDSALKDELEDALKTQSVLREEITSQQINNQHLSHLVQEKETRIYELENELDRLKASVSEHEQLLDGSRSDKVTISRALLQNKQLKEQLEEIQDGFIRMSNDKMDLATQVSSLEHANGDLESRLSQCASLYQEAKRDVDTYKTEAIHLRQHVAQLQTEVANSRTSPELHDEGDEIIDIMNLKIQAAEQSARELAAENHELRASLEALKRNTAPPNGEVFSVSENTAQQSGQVLGNLPYSVTDETDAKSHSMEDAKGCSPQTTEMRPDAVAMLQEKFTAVMKEKAELLNRVEILEHTNTQLQNECDTIGEYIALYHNQRQILKQRHREKDEYISTIIQEREAMQGKVEQLQTLIFAMLNKQDLTEEVTSTPLTHLNTNSASSLSDENHGGTPLRPSVQPDLVPKSDIAPPEENYEDSPLRVLPGHSRKVHTSSESSSPEREDATATQILSLLEQMQKPIDPGLSSRISMPSGFCMRYIGPYTAI